MTQVRASVAKSLAGCPFALIEGAPSLIPEGQIQKSKDWPLRQKPKGIRRSWLRSPQRKMSKANQAGHYLDSLS